MAVTVPGSNAGYFNEVGTTSTPSVNKPSSAATGRTIYIALCTEDSTTVTCTSRPTGFSRLGGGTEADPVATDTTGNDMRLFVYYKVLDGSEGSSFSFTMSSSVYMSVAATIVIEAHTVDLVEVRSRAISASGPELGAIPLASGNLALAYANAYDEGPIDAGTFTNWSSPNVSDMAFYTTTSTASDTGSGMGSARWVSVAYRLIESGGGAQTLTVDTAVLTLTGQQPAVTASSAAALSVDTATLTITGQQPAVAPSSAASVVVDIAALALTGQQPTLAGSSPVTITVDVSTLTLTGTQPALTPSSTAPLTVDVAALALTGQQPAATGTGETAITVDTAALTLTAVEVNLAAGGQFLSVDIAALTLTGQQPALAGSSPATVTADPAALALTGQDPAPTGSGAATVTPDSAQLTLTAINVDIAAGGEILAADTATLTLTGGQPAVTTTGAATIDVTPATLNLTGGQPELGGTGTIQAAIDTALLTLTAMQIAIITGAISPVLTGRRLTTSSGDPRRTTATLDPRRTTS